jgi:hypothetical protein
MSKITNVKQHIEDTKYLHIENIKELEKIRNKELETKGKEVDKLNKDLIKNIKSHFKGVKVKINVDEYGLIIIIDGNDNPILLHNYDTSTFEGITRETYKSIIASYEEYWGEPKKEQEFTPYEEQDLTIEEYFMLNGNKIKLPQYNNGLLK